MSCEMSFCPICKNKIDENKIIKISLSPLPDYGDIFTLDDFIENVRNGVFDDSDGHGYYATEEGITDILISPYIVRNYLHSRAFSHVIWFNK